MWKQRVKLLLILCSLWILLGIVTYFISGNWLHKNNQRLALYQAHEEINHLRNAINVNLIAMTTMANDWANQENLYQFMTKQSPDFVNQYLNQQFFNNTNLDFVLIVDQKLNVLAKKTVLQFNSPNVINLQEESRTINIQALANQLNIHKNQAGLLSTNQGIILLATHVISNNSQPKGLLILGRYFNNALINHTPELSHINFNILPISLLSSSTVLEKAYKNALNHPDGYVENADQQFPDVYFVLRNPNNQPIALVQFKLSKSVYFSILKNYQRNLFILIGCSFLFMLVMWTFIRLVIAKRLASLTQQVMAITKDADFSKRISIPGNDDISAITDKFNLLLNVIENSYNELDNRVKERTKDLQLVNQRLQHEIDEHKITEKKLQSHKAHLSYMAHFDSLTSLPNRILFNEILNKEIAQANINGQQLAILYIDLDRFKNINDSCGHSIGDKALRFLSTRLRSVLRTKDTIARLGGDEFIILIPDISDVKSVSIIAEKLLGVFIEPLVFDNREFYLNASIGISIYPKDGLQLEDLQKNADLAMYRAKKSGGGVYQFYNQDMLKWTFNHVELESSLRKALINNEFLLYFQPIVQLPSRRIAKFEALIRWQHPEHGIIEPDKFIPIAEETGIIVPIGEFVIREACRIAKLWQLKGIEFGRIAINLSPIQLRDVNFVKLVENILKHENVSPDVIEFEITESAVIRSDFSSLEKLNQLSQMGIVFAIDDFGTGYSSITYLKQYPISFIKIDRSFVKGLPNQRQDVAITNSIIRLSHELEFKVIAEGVETMEQLTYLISQNCDMAQGYFFSKPIPHEEVEQQFSLIKIQSKYDSFGQ